MRYFVRTVLLGGVLTIVTSIAAAAPPPTPAAAAGSATAPPQSSSPTPGKNPREDLLHPEVNYSIWLYAGPGAVIFLVLFYNEWDQRRKKKLAASPERNPDQP